MNQIKENQMAYILSFAFAFHARIFIVLPSSRAVATRWSHDKWSRRYRFHASAITILAFGWFCTQFTSRTLTFWACIDYIYNNILVHTACSLCKRKIHRNLLCSTKSKLWIGKIKITKISTTFEMTIAKYFTEIKWAICIVMQLLWGNVLIHELCAHLKSSSGLMVDVYCQCWLNPWPLGPAPPPPLRFICSVVVPNVSYSFRLVSSLRISYASDTSWNFLLASGSFLFVSGWYFLANW